MAPEILTRSGHGKAVDWFVVHVELDRKDFIRFSFAKVVLRCFNVRHVDGRCKLFYYSSLIDRQISIFKPPFTADDRKRTMDKIIKGKLVLPAYLTLDARELIRAVSRSSFFSRYDDKSRRSNEHRFSALKLFKLTSRSVSIHIVVFETTCIDVI